MKSQFIASILVLSFIAIASFSSCLKKENALPPDITKVDPNVPVNSSIIDMVSLLDTSISKVISTDITVSGVVIADDRNGNFFKTIILQDATGGIAISIDINNLYTDYPVGRKLYVKAKGLTLGLESGTPKLGFGLDARGSVLPIPGGRVNDFIIKADIGHAVKDTVVSFSFVKNADFTSEVYKNLLNRLVTVAAVQFADTVVNYTEPSGTTSRYMLPCDGSSTTGIYDAVPLRTSSFAKFAAYQLPFGKGNITGVFSQFSGTAQLTIRDTSDVKFTGARCTGGLNSNNAVLITIDSVRKLFGTSITLGNIKISGVVISDRSASNIDSKSIVLQNGKAGILLRFTTDHSFNLGDSLEVNLRDAFLSTFNDLLQISGNSFSPAFSTLKATGIIVNPKVIKVADLLNQGALYESTLVKILSAKITGGITYANPNSNTSRNLTDSTGVATLYTTKDATFGLVYLPTVPKDITGIVGRFRTNFQVSIRNLGDVQ